MDVSTVGGSVVDIQLPAPVFACTNICVVWPNLSLLIETLHCCSCRCVVIAHA